MLGPTPDDYGADRLKRRAPSLLEHRPAGVAEARLLPPQAGGDGAGVGNFAGAKAIDVGRAGPLLFGRRQISQCGTGRQQRDQESERRSKMGAACDG